MSTLIATLERTVYSNEENGYTVAKVRIKNQRQLVTIVGTNLPTVPGETLELQGEWVVDKKYGQQFKVESCRSVAPATVHGVKRYLASGLIKGVGPFVAERLVNKFGAKTLEVIENEPERLLEVGGIGPVKKEWIHQAVKQQREIRELMLFFQGHELPAGLAFKVFKEYGSRALKVVKEDPYRLAEDIFGIGFRTADRIAVKLGLPLDAPSRVEAGVVYLLNELAADGHVFYPYDELVNQASELLGVDGQLVKEALQALSSPGRERVVIEQLLDSDRAVYYTPLYRAEVNVARRFLNLMHFPHFIRPAFHLDTAINEAQARQRLELSPAQREAVTKMVLEKALIITGGPGTGKTTLVKTFLTIAEKMGRRVLLAAPTGRAAKRLAETTGEEAKTIHRLLEYAPNLGTFKRDQTNLLRGDVVLIDEASMVDLVLMNSLLKAIPLHASLILVGDVDQLPSVGPGNVLRELINSEVIPVVRLSEVFRQAKESLIVTNAHRINIGQFPLQPRAEADELDFYFIEKEEPEEILQLIRKLCLERIPEKFGFDPIEDIQVLSPMHRGLVGAINLNQELKNWLNSGGVDLPFGGRSLKEGDKVMQLRNNYDLDIFNGDIGRVERIDREEQEVTVRFYDRSVNISFLDLDELALAYAITVHKSQGSEYPAVVMPLITQHYMMLQRNLLYTALTRAKKLMVLIGSKKAVAMAIKNDKIEKRFTNLKLRLQGIDSSGETL